MKAVVEELIGYAVEHKKFELKLIAYRRGRPESNQHSILIFVENSASFAFLYERSN